MNDEEDGIMSNDGSSSGDECADEADNGAGVVARRGREDRGQERGGEAYGG